MMKGCLIDYYQLSDIDIPCVEANPSSLSDQDLLDAGVSSNDLGRVRDGLLRGECYYCTDTPRQSLVVYKRAEQAYKPHPAVSSQLHGDLLQRLGMRFPRFFAAPRDAQFKPGEGGVSMPYRDEAPSVDYHFTGNNTPEGGGNIRFWLKLFFYREDAEGDKHPVADAPFRLEGPGSPISAGVASPENGAWRHDEFTDSASYNLYWGPPGGDPGKTADTPFLKVLTLNKQYDIPINTIHEILFSPNEHFCIVLDEAGLMELEQFDQTFDPPAQQLQTARTQTGDDPADLLAAQEAVREALRAKAETSGDGPAPLTTGKVDFNEVIRVGKQKYSLVPAEFIKKYKNRKRHFFDIPSDIASSLRDSVHKEHDEEIERELKDALEPWRWGEGENKGKLNTKKLKRVFAKVSVNIAKTWDLAVYEQKGQIPSRLFAHTLFGPQIAAFLSDECEAIDAWIAQVNQDLNTSVRQYEKSRDAALAALDKSSDSKSKKPQDYFLPEDWDLARRMVKDIWGAQDDLYKEIHDEEYNFVKDERTRCAIRKKIASKPLPLPVWDYSMGAQLMRYSLGASVKANFDLLQKGRLAIGAGAEFDAALAEAKADGRLYYPHKEGHPLKPAIHAKWEVIVYKEYGHSENGTIANEKHGQDPHFAVDSCLLTPGGAVGVLNRLIPIDLVAQTGHRAELDPARRDFFIQVIGHTSAPGSKAHNEVLGLRRAMITADFIRQRTVNWTSLFVRDVWGQEEVNFMACFILIQGNSLNSATSIDWQQIGRSDKKTSLVEQLKEQLPDLNERCANLLPALRKQMFLQKSDWGQLVSSSGGGHPKGRGETRLERLITEYQKAILRYASTQLNLSFNPLKNIQLYDLPYLSKGETEPKALTQDETVSNRRCEFIAWEIDQENSEIREGDRELYLGDLRGQLEGSISAWAGVNLMLGGEIAIASPGGVLAVVGAVKDAANEGKVSQGTIQQAKGAFTAGGNAAAFAGAKAEAGLKASVDWRKPPPPNQDTSEHNARGQPATVSAEFKPFGSVGYAVTGMVGIGAQADFKIGFDDESGRFVIKVKAEAALGPGIGGQLDIVVGIAHLWDFVVFVHDELRRNNFSYLDMFETQDDESDIDVFELFSAFSWRMLLNGHPVSAIATLGVGAVAANQAVELLQFTDDLLEDWEESLILQEQAEKLADTIFKQPEHIKYLTPETKGRILFDLIKTSPGWLERLDNLRQFDINKKREDATLILLTRGIESRIDWRETLEHMGDWRDDELVFQLKSNASVAEKAARAKRNLLAIQEELLDDTEKWNQLMKHIEQLPEDSNAP